jgi:membrane fusion protein, copper/silver efflux system
MKKTVYAIFLLLFAAAAFLAGVRFNQRNVGKTSDAGGRKILYYVDPMHPAYKSDKPGIAPDCGMQLEPVYEDHGSSTSGSAESGTIPGTVSISPQKQQIIGVRVSPAEKTSGTQALRLLGRIVPDETRVYSVNSGVEGTIREVSAVTSGSYVKKDQWLATIFSLESRSPSQAYLTSLQVLDAAAARSGEAPEQTRTGRETAQLGIERLKVVGMSTQQIEEIKRTREVPLTVRILAPADGFVIARNISLGQKFEKATEWYRIADLSRVWILADVFENDAQFLRPGARARFSLPGQRKTFSAKVSEILPQFDPATRTLKVRLEADNPGYVLRPDMFVDVELPVALSPAISLPVDAVLDSGLKKTVFVERGEGVFEPRQVQTGWHFGDRVQVVKGVMEGERIVVSGTFLVDSESRLKAAAAGLYGATAKDPVCGMDVDEARAKASGKKDEYRGTTYYFCSDGCQRKFQKSPDQYAQPVQHDRNPNVKQSQAAPAKAKDPSCGMEVETAQARASGRTSEYGGQTYYFCSDGCKQKFDRDPAHLAQTTHARSGGEPTGH